MEQKKKQNWSQKLPFTVAGIDVGGSEQKNPPALNERVPIVLQQLSAF